MSVLETGSCTGFAVTICIEFPVQLRIILIRVVRCCVPNHNRGITIGVYLLESGLEMC